ncbi:MAG: hypothetical protein IKQ41_01320 [Clostridia bacterium]|nr:hypothetical protein [Clostridia bacterium]
MKKSKFIIAVCLLGVLCVVMTGCSFLDTTPTPVSGTQADTQAQKAVADTLASHQATPTDINYSLERYNLIRRAYWVNGQREKANMLICEVEKPLGYIVLFSGTTVVGRFIVDGKVSSLNSFLTPSNVDKATGTSSGGYTTITTEMADVDGSYGENDSGIFFFTPDGRYIEWTGTYLYSDIPFEVSNPVVCYEAESK